MTLSQYRTIVAYMNYWTPLYPELGLDVAIRDCGIAESKADIIAELARAGHRYDEESGLLVDTQEEQQ